jgi:hypothetical protein
MKKLADAAILFCPFKVVRLMDHFYRVHASGSL